MEAHFDHFYGFKSTVQPKNETNGIRVHTTYLICKAFLYGWPPVYIDAIKPFGDEKLFVSHLLGMILISDLTLQYVGS